MSVDSEADLEGLLKVGRVVALALRSMFRALAPGIATRDLDAIGRRVLEEHGARPAPELAYGFPGATCISINDEAAHGIPGARVVRDGDLVNIDVSAELDGFWADSGASFPVGEVAEPARELCRTAERALTRALGTVRKGVPLRAIGKAVEAEARSSGFRVIRNLCGHGVGRALHEEPHQVLNFDTPAERRRFVAGQVLTVEPFLSTGTDRVVEADDGWTLRTPDGSLVAQYEHTIIVTREEPILVTTCDGLAGWERNGHG